MGIEEKKLGARGEDAAVAFLKRVGMSIEARNWTCKQGEVDIVCRDGETLVFVEVKTRKGTDQGTPEEAITPTKQKKYLRLARAYLAGLGGEEPPVRFDVISILVFDEERALLRHHRSAFTAE